MVSARNRSKDRGVDISALGWRDDPVEIARSADIDLMVEVIGGADGPAKAATEAALARGAHVVTANKAMIAAHGPALAASAERAGAALRFEAAVAGGIPIVKALREGLAANAVDRVYGVLNGTCNYILTEMERTGRAYGEILAEAQEKGYAEADPTADVGGFDAGHKLAILSALAFGAAVDLPGVAIEGIDRIALSDIQFARELGYRIKQIASARRGADGVLQQVAPCLVPADGAIGALDGVTNAVVCEGDFVGQTVYEGPGAGEGPTASAIVGDIIDIARFGADAPFGAPASEMAPAPRAEPSAARAAYYLRLGLVDRPGALAEVAATLAAADVSVDRMRQLGRDPEAATVLIVTHETTDGALRRAVAAIDALSVSQSPAVALRIEDA